jgi:hypothetical protein
MTEPAHGGPDRPKEAKLRGHDWILQPLLGLATICLIAILAESIARQMLPDGVSSLHLTSCTVHNDTPAGARALPNSVCWEKLPEGRLAEYEFNSCGDRAGMECRPKPPGTYRIVMTGTSMAVGRYVQRGNTFAALLPIELARLTRRKVELYNESLMQGFPISTALRFNEILAAQPDMVLWILTPIDLEVTPEGLNQNPPPALPESAAKPLSLARAWYLLKTAYATDSISQMLRNHFNRTQSALLLRHFLYESQSLYVKSFLMGSEDAEFLRTNPNAKWLIKLKEFERDAAEVESRAAAAKVPLVAVLVPNRAQAAMISAGEWPLGYNPYKLDDEIRAIVTSHGGIYIDIFLDFRNIPNPEQYYFPVDGHPNADGHAIVSDLLARELTSGAAPALNVAAQPAVPLEQGNYLSHSILDVEKEQSFK